MEKQVATFAVKKGLAQMLKGGVIMDVVTHEHARIAEDAGAVAVMVFSTSLCFSNYSSLSVSLHGDCIIFVCISTCLLQPRR